MSAATRQAEYLDHTGQNLLRVLIASYFIATALGLVPGTNGAILVGTVFGEAVAEYVGRTIVFTLAYLVLMGMWLRPAALLLALTMFWSSYVTNFAPQSTLVIGNFWRDLALIGALMMTYAQSGGRSGNRRAMLRFTPSVRRIRPRAQATEAITPRRVSRGDAPSIRASRDNVVDLRQPERPRTRREPISENIFRDDFATLAS